MTRGSLDDSQVQSFQLLSFDQFVAVLRANGHANVLTVKIAASELKKKTVEMTS